MEKVITNYENYTVDEFGNVWSKITGQKVNQNIGAKNYMIVVLCEDGKRKIHYVHRLVADAFIENPNHCKYVNHKDRNKDNNAANNLEWVDSYCISNNKKKKEKRKKKKSRYKPVLCLDLELSFPSIKEASEQTGIDSGNICRCCRGRTKTAGGMFWRYSDTTKQKILYKNKGEKT